MSAYRYEQKMLAIADRGGVYNATCDNCGEQGDLEYHEIVSRGRTVKNEVARQLSFRREICALLCRDCHTGGNNAHNPEAAERLLLKNIAMYGYDAVRDAYDAVATALSTPLTVELPESPTAMRRNNSVDNAPIWGLMIVEYLKSVPDGYEPDTDVAKNHLCFTDEQMEAGLIWAAARGYIVIEDDPATYTPLQ